MSNQLQVVSGIVGSILSLVAGIAYIFAALHGKVQSNKVTWGVWIPVTFMLAFGYWQANGWVASIWVPIISVINTCATFFILYLYGKRGQWSWVEKTVLCGAAVIVALWSVYPNGVVAMTLTLCLDAIGAVPLVITAYRDPKDEYAPAWYLGLMANIVNLLAVEKWDYANAAYPIYLLLLTLVVSALVWTARFRAPPTTTSI